MFSYFYLVAIGVIPSGICIIAESAISARAILQILRIILEAEKRAEHEDEANGLRPVADPGVILPIFAGAGWSGGPISITKKMPCAARRRASMEKKNRNGLPVFQVVADYWGGPEGRWARYSRMD